MLFLRPRPPLYRRRESLQDLDKLSQIAVGARQLARHACDEWRGLEETPLRIPPAARREQPLLEDEAEELRIDFTQNPCGILRPPVVHVGMTLPQLE